MPLNWKAAADGDGMEAVSGQRKYLAKQKGDSFLLTCWGNLGQPTSFVCSSWQDMYSVANAVDAMGQIGDRVEPGEHDENEP